MSDSCQHRGHKTSRRRGHQTPPFAAATPTTCLLLHVLPPSTSPLPPSPPVLLLECDWVANKRERGQARQGGQRVQVLWGAGGSGVVCVVSCTYSGVLWCVWCRWKGRWKKERASCQLHTHMVSETLSLPGCSPTQLSTHTSKGLVNSMRGLRGACRCMYVLVPLMQPLAAADAHWHAWKPTQRPSHSTPTHPHFCNLVVGQHQRLKVLDGSCSSSRRCEQRSSRQARSGMSTAQIIVA